GRGTIRERSYADIVIFDLATLNSESSFAHPTVYPEGIDAVLVNGQLVVDRGTHMGTRAGKVLTRR
ncbi:MAG TPA: hypothetical protein VEJ84_09850, partial [Acidimicrobiales bacterium]|nr:hypothetical protein [Acidimicrobiales bacterium]